MIEIDSCDEGLGVGRLPRVCVVVWRGAVTAERFQRQCDGLARVVGASAERAAFLCVIEPGAPPPDDVMRRATVEMIARHRDRLAGVACVIEGQGFLAALARSVLAGMALMQPHHRSHIRFADSVDSAARWIAERCAGASAAEMVAACARLRYVP